MRHLLIGLTLLAAAGTATADIAIPPPQGKKFVPVKTTVRLEKEVKGYVFFTRARAGQRGAEPKKLELGTEKAVDLPEWGRRPMTLYAVPEDKADKLKTAKEWNDALANKGEGILAHAFAAQETVDKGDERAEIRRAFLVQSVDAKDGIKVEEKADGKKDEPKAEKKDKEEEVTAAEPRYLVAGGAAAAGVALAGLWAVRRRKAE